MERCWPKKHPNHATWRQIVGGSLVALAKKCSLGTARTTVSDLDYLPERDTAGRFEVRRSILKVETRAWKRATFREIAVSKEQPGKQGIITRLPGGAESLMRDGGLLVWLFMRDIRSQLARLGGSPKAAKSSRCMECPDATN